MTKILNSFQNSGETRGFSPRCVKAESLGPEGSMIGYKTKKKNEHKTYKKKHDRI